MEDRAAWSAPDLAAVFAALPGGTAVFAADPPRFTVLAASDGLLAVSHRARDEAVGRPLAEAFPNASPDDPQASGLTDLRASLAEAVRTGAPQHLARQRYDLQRPDGTWETQYWDAVNIPVPGPDGAVRHVLHQIADVTAQVRGDAAAAQAASAEQRAQGILERMSDSHCVLDRDFQIVGVNAAAERLLARPRETLLGRSHWEMFPASVGAPVGRAFRRVVAEGIEQHLTHHYAGEGYDLRLELDAYPTDEGGVAMFWRDVTERVPAEAALRLAAARDAYRLTLTDALRGAGDPVEAQAVATRVLGDHLEASRVMYGEANPGSTETFTNHREYRRDPLMPSSLGSHRWYDFGIHVVTEMRAGRTIVADEVCLHPEHSADELAAYEALEIRAYVAVPLVRQGQIVAFLAVNHTTPHAWTAEEVALIEETAERTWAAVERARAEESLRVSEVRQAFLLSLSDLLRPLGDPLEVQRVAVAALGLHLGVNRALYFEVQSDGDTVRTGPGYLDGVAALPPLLRMSDFGVLAEQYRRNEPSVAHDVLADPSIGPALTDLYAAIEVRAAIGVPLVKEGRVVSVMGVNQSKPRTWTATDVALIEAVAERTWEAVERARAGEALRESEAQLQALIANLPGGAVFVVDKDLRYLVAEGEAMSDAGHKSSDFLGKSIREALQEDLASAYEPYFRKALAGEHFELEHALDGRAYLTRGVPLRSHGEEVYAVLAASFDITERKRAEGESREADKRKDEFLAMLAHELRNPLAAISSATQVVKQLTRDNATVQRPREVIERQLHHLTRLVDDLLDMSRVTWGKINLKQETLSLATVLQRAVEANRPLIDARAQQLTITLPPLAVQVVGDPTRLVQVFGNLLNNAAKYTETGGHIALHTAIAAEEAIVRVSDNGCGLSESLLPHVFELFTQARRSLDRSQGGLGVGLALVHSLVKMHGGEVEVHSAGLGGGSEFVVRLPLARSGDKPEPPLLEEATAQAPTTAPRLRVLVVEDNADAAEMLVILLQHDGDEVRLARDGVSALNEARDFQPQVVLCDLGLPGLSGFEVASRLREHPECQGTLLVALSGYGRDDDRRKSQLAGFDHHLTKPVDTEVMAALIEQRRWV